MAIQLYPANYTWPGFQVCRTCVPPPTYNLTYGFAALSGFAGLTIIDGMNERGLAGGLLWLWDSPAQTNYT